MENKLDSLELDFRISAEFVEKARYIDVQIEKLEFEKKELSNKAIEEGKKIRLVKVQEIHNKLKKLQT